MRLAAIPEKKYQNYRREVIFGAYKWDPQVGDRGTVSRHALLMDAGTADQLERWAEALAGETVRMEAALARNPVMMERLGIPKAIRRAYAHLANGDAGRHVRLMRFDFHPTDEGWAVSEVNSDVPGGLAEGSVLPEIAERFFPDATPRRHVGRVLLDAFRARSRPGGTVAFVHATSYSDDLQTMRFLGDIFEAEGYTAVYAAPDHIRWSGGRATVSFGDGEAALDGLLRFFPLEWMVDLPRSADWHGFFGATTPSCNHPAAFLSQSKRLPLVWDELGVDVPVWKRLLPPTCDPAELRELPEGWIWKPALGRVGEDITIPGAMAEKELRAVVKNVKRRPGDWVAQWMFHSRPLAVPDGSEYHCCVGVFTVDGRAAGFYARASPSPRIDGGAEDVPVLVHGS